MLQFIASLAYLCLAPVYPQFLRQHAIEKEYFGLVVSVLSLSFIGASVLTGKVLLKYIPRLTVSYIGIGLIGVNLVGIGCLDFGQLTKSQIIGLSFLFQIIGGAGKGMANTANFAILSTYKAQRQTYISYF